MLFLWLKSPSIMVIWLVRTATEFFVFSFFFQHQLCVQFQYRELRLSNLRGTFLHLFLVVGALIFELFIVLAIPTGQFAVANLFFVASLMFTGVANHFVTTSINNSCSIIFFAFRISKFILEQWSK